MYTLFIKKLNIFVIEKQIKKINQINCVNMDVLLSESPLEHRQEAEEEKKTTFGNAESLRFQNSMFELVEELRIRRVILLWAKPT